MSRNNLIIGVMVSILILMLVSMSGCRFCTSVMDGIFGKPADSTSDIITPAATLYKTIWKTNWVTTLAIPIIALGAVAMFNGAAKLGMSAIIFGSVNLFMALATARFAFWMAVFGLIGSTAAVLMSVLIKNKALKDVVSNVQEIKASAANGGTKEEIVKDIKEVLCGQAKTTQKLVRRIKNKLA